MTIEFTFKGSPVKIDADPSEIRAALTEALTSSEEFYQIAVEATGNLLARRVAKGAEKAVNNALKEKVDKVYGFNAKARKIA